MKWLDLFSGGGMYARGLEQAGHEVIGFCEVDKFCHKILKKHWPMKPISWSIELLVEKLKALSVDFPAKTFPLPETVPDLPESVQDYSGSWLRPFAWFDQSSGSWRTWQTSFNQAGEIVWAIYSEPWPASGIMQNGIVWEREPLAHPIIAPAHTFLPTVMATEGKGSCRDRYVGSPNTIAGKMSAGLRNCETDPIYLDPIFAERVMGLPDDYTLSETETPHV